jgi:hypothetical protein
MDNIATSGSNVSYIKISIVIFMLFIALISLVSAFFSALPRSRDRIRVRDVALIQKFLESYKSNQGFYPSATNNQPTDWKLYLSDLPKPPTADGSCTNQANNYQYQSLNQGGSYSLSFCLGGKSGDFHAGLNYVTSK